MTKKITIKQAESFLKRLSVSSKILSSVFEDDNVPQEHFEKAFLVVLSSFNSYYVYRTVVGLGSSSSSLSTATNHTHIHGIPRPIFLAMITHPLFTSNHLEVLCDRSLSWGNWMDITFFYKEKFKHNSDLLLKLESFRCKYYPDSKLVDSCLSKRTNSYKRPSTHYKKFFSDLDNVIDFINNDPAGKSLGLLSDKEDVRNLTIALSRIKDE